MLASEQRSVSHYGIIVADHRVILFRDILTLTRSSVGTTRLSLSFLQLYLVSRLNVKTLCSNKHAINIHAKVLARVRQSQQLKELGVIQKEESTEDESLLF